MGLQYLAGVALTCAKGIVSPLTIPGMEDYVPIPIDLPAEQEDINTPVALSSSDDVLIIIKFILCQ